MIKEKMDAFYIRIKETLENGTKEECEALMNERFEYLKSIEWKKEHISLLQDFEEKDRELIKEYTQRFLTIKQVSSENYDRDRERNQFKLYE